MKSLIIIAFLAFLTVSCKENNKKNLAETKALIEHEDAYRQANPLAALQEGNAEYTKKLAENPKLHEEFEHNKKEQHPFAALVSCSDSRVPPSAVFNQDLGHLFIIRTAGNLVSNLELGSIEYAVEHLHTPLVVVMGHSGCGAIKAFIEGGNAPDHIKDIVNTLSSEKEIKAISGHKHDDEAFVAECVEANVRHTVKAIKADGHIIPKHIKEGKLQVVGAIYDLSSGKVQFLN